MLVGPNAAGKSTLLKVACGLLRPSSGETHFARNARIGYLAHESFIYPGLSALENLKFWSAFYGDRCPEKEILHALKRVGLERSARENAGSFSRGMAQRLSLARLLLTSPSIILLDEPDSGLDNSSMQVLVREIGHARQQGAGIIWVSHDLNRDRDKADKILELQGGEQSFWGEAKELPGASLHA